MGYAMFAARKIMLTDSINTTQLELTNITNQLMDLADLGAAVSDGEISAFDIAECQDAGLTCSYGWDMATGQYKDGEYYLGLLKSEVDARKMTGLSVDANLGGAALGTVAGAALAMIPGVNLAVGAMALIGGIGGAILGNQLSPKTQKRNQYVKQYKEEYAKKKQEEVARDLQQKIARMENELEKRKNNLDTKLQAYNAELESVKQAESQGIKNATPNYAGA